MKPEQVENRYVVADIYTAFHVAAPPQTHCVQSAAAITFAKSWGTPQRKQKTSFSLPTKKYDHVHYENEFKLNFIFQKPWCADLNKLKIIFSLR